MDFRTRFSSRLRAAFATKGDSLTQQCYKDESDINVIIRRYSEPQAPLIGTTPVSGPRVPLWGDFSDVPDIRSAFEKMKAAEASFINLPSEVRSRFQNNPLELLAFVADRGNRDEAIKLGLIEKEPTPEPAVPSTAAVNSETLADQAKK